MFAQRKLGYNNSWHEVIEYTTLACLLYLLYNSRALRSRTAYILYGGIALVTAGNLLRYVRWSYTTEAQLLGLVLITIGYLLFFLRNTRHRWIDIVKLTWIVIALAAYLWFLLYLPGQKLMENLALITFWPLYLSVCYLEMRGDDQSLNEEDEEPELPEDIL